MQPGDLLKGAPVPHPSPDYFLAHAHIPPRSWELQSWPVSSLDRWWISPCIGSVSWSNAQFGRKITGSVVLLMLACVPEPQPTLAPPQGPGGWNALQPCPTLGQMYDSACSLKSALKTCGMTEMLNVVSLICNLHLLRGSRKGLGHIHRLGARGRQCRSQAEGQWQSLLAVGHLQSPWTSPKAKETTCICGADNQAAVPSLC